MDTIKSSVDISILFSQGIRYQTPYLTFIINNSNYQVDKKNKFQHGQQGRVAFIAGKKVGNAVWRNSAKRRMRVLCLDLKGPWDDYDVIFLAKSPIMDVSYSKVLRVCKKAINHVFSL